MTSSFAVDVTDGTTAAKATLGREFSASVLAFVGIGLMSAPNPLTDVWHTHVGRDTSEDSDQQNDLDQQSGGHRLFFSVCESKTKTKSCKTFDVFRDLMFYVCLMCCLLIEINLNFELIEIQFRA